VVCAPNNELWRRVVPYPTESRVWISGGRRFVTLEVTELEALPGEINQQILGIDVAAVDAKGGDMNKGLAELAESEAERRGDLVF
jgi:hypothetical protein